MVGPGQFVSGADIEWRELIKAVFGGAVFAVFSAWAGFFVGWGEALASLYGGASSWLAQVINESLGSMSDVIILASRDLGGWILRTGLPAYVLAILAALVLAYISAWVRNRVIGGG
jgi:hypothetical protein